MLASNSHLEDSAPRAGVCCHHCQWTTISITVLSKSTKTDVSILQTFNFSHDILYILADKSRTCFGLFCVSLCMHTHYVWYVHRCVHVHLFMHACMCAGQRLMSGVLVYHSPPWFLRQGLPWNLTQTSATLQIHTVISRLYVDTGAHNSGPHACMASTLPTESSCISWTLLQLTFQLPTTPERPEIMCSWVRAGRGVWLDSQDKVW